MKTVWRYWRGELIEKKNGDIALKRWKKGKRKVSAEALSDASGQPFFPFFHS